MTITSLTQSLNDEITDQVLLNTARAITNSDLRRYIARNELYLVDALSLVAKQRSLTPAEQSFLKLFNRNYADERSAKAEYEITKNDTGVDNPLRRNIGATSYDDVLPYPYASNEQVTKRQRPEDYFPNPYVVPTPGAKQDGNIKRYALWALVAIGGFMIYRSTRK